MLLFRYLFTFLTCLGVLLSFAGCKKGNTSAAPIPLETDKAPSTLREAFAKTTGESRQMADDAIMYLDQPDYSGALLVLESLLRQADLTREQRTLASQALLTANRQVAAAAEKGDDRAKKLLRLRSAAK